MGNTYKPRKSVHVPDSKGGMTSTTQDSKRKSFSRQSSVKSWGRLSDDCSELSIADTSFDLLAPICQEKIHYEAVKGDEVDEMLGDLVNRYYVRIPIKML